MNNFKRNDMVTISTLPQLGPVRVKRTEGDYVYYEYPTYNGANTYYWNCTLAKTVLDFLKDGNKIEAIKLHRLNTGLGLKEAKDAVEAMERSYKNHNAGESLGSILDTALNPTFVFGDRVKLTSGYDQDPGTFLRYASFDRIKAFVDWDNGVGNDNSFPVSAMVKVTTVAAIVALNVNGIYQPSMKPMIHKSVEAATKEAQRLAIQHPGVEFGTFVLASRTTAPAPVATTVAVSA